MRILSFIIFFLMAFIALGFSLLNYQMVNVSLYLVEFTIPLAVALSLELVAGVIIGFILCFLQMRGLKLENKNLHQTLAEKMNKK